MSLWYYDVGVRLLLMMMSVRDLMRDPTLEATAMRDQVLSTADSTDIRTCERNFSKRERTGHDFGASWKTVLTRPWKNYFPPIRDAQMSLTQL